MVPVIFRQFFGLITNFVINQDLFLSHFEVKIQFDEEKKNKKNNPVVCSKGKFQTDELPNTREHIADLL